MKKFIVGLVLLVMSSVAFADKDIYSFQLSFKDGGSDGSYITIWDQNTAIGKIVQGNGDSYVRGGYYFMYVDDITKPLSILMSAETPVEIVAYTRANNTYVLYLRPPVQDL